MKAWRFSIGLVALLAGSLGSSPARAEPGAHDRASAEALFQEATSLMDHKKFAEACEKFAASQELDPALGTLLYLADCYDQAGRSASAWALFREVEDRSQRAGQLDRQSIAKQRAVALEAKLSKLEIRVAPAKQVPGLELRVGGSVVPKASWNVALPVDPGATKLEVSAPGKVPWSTQLEIAVGPSSRTFELPALRDAPRPRPVPVQAARPADVPPVSSTQRTIGYVMGGLSVVAFGVGGFFAYQAREQNAESKTQCRPEDANACSQHGYDLRVKAKTSANLATISGASGAALALSALTLVLTAPSQSTPDERRQASAIDGFQLGVRGAW